MVIMKTIWFEKLENIALRSLALTVDYNGNRILEGTEVSIFEDMIKYNGMEELYKAESQDIYNGDIAKKPTANIEEIDISQLENKYLIELAKRVKKGNGNVLSKDELKNFYSQVFANGLGAALEEEFQRIRKGNSSEDLPDKTNNTPADATPGNRGNVAPAKTTATADTESVGEEDDIQVVDNTTDNTKDKKVTFLLPRSMNMDNVKNQELKNIAIGLFGNKKTLNEKEVKLLYNDAMIASFTSKELEKSFTREFVNAICAALPETVKLSEIKNPRLRELAKTYASSQDRITTITIYNLRLDAANEGLLDVFEAEMDTIKNGSKPKATAEAKSQSSGEITAADIQPGRDLPEKIDCSGVYMLHNFEVLVRWTFGDNKTKLNYEDIEKLRDNAITNGVSKCFDVEMAIMGYDITTGEENSAVTELRSKLPSQMSVSGIKNPDIKSTAERLFPDVETLNSSQILALLKFSDMTNELSEFRAEIESVNNKGSRTAAAAKTKRPASTAAGMVGNTAPTASSAVNPNGVVEFNGGNPADRQKITKGNLPKGTTAVTVTGNLNGEPISVTHYAYEDCPKEQIVHLNGYPVHKSVVKPFMDMAQAAQKECGVKVFVASGIRSTADQRNRVFPKKFKDKTAPTEQELMKRLTESAPPGFSEHHTGLAIDVCSTETVDFGPNGKYEKLGIWLKEHAAEYGFEISFPENNDQGLIHEPWHLRYVGTEDNPSLYAQEVFAAVHKDQARTQNIYYATNE